MPVREKWFIRIAQLPARKTGKTAIARAQGQEDLKTLRPLGREWLNLIGSSVNLSEGGPKLVPYVAGGTAH
jgi:hypothetical protein